MLPPCFQVVAPLIIIGLKSPLLATFHFLFSFRIPFLFFFSFLTNNIRDLQASEHVIERGHGGEMGIGFPADLKEEDLDAAFEFLNDEDEDARPSAYPGPAVPFHNIFFFGPLAVSDLRN